MHYDIYLRIKKPVFECFVKAIYEWISLILTDSVTDFVWTL